MSIVTNCIHPNVASDLQADSTWQNYHIYSTPEAVYRGEIGRVHGVRFVESTLAPVTRGSADAGAVSSAGISSIAYGTVIFGKGFYGVTELDGGIKTFTVTGPTKSDPLAQLDTYGYPISGHIKSSLIVLEAEMLIRRKREIKISHRERLNEKTVKADAIVRSLGK